MSVAAFRREQHPLPPLQIPHAPQALQARLGRLFFTPEARARLDALKHAPPAPENEAASAPRHVHGRLQRQGGAAVLWIDGRFETETKPPAWPDLLQGGHLRQERH